MKIFTNNAAAILLERMETLEEGDHHGWRCIYLQLHDKQERFNAMLRAHFINRAIIDMLARDEGYIYFCEDGDIVILFEGALKPVIDKLAHHFGDLDRSQLRGQPTGTLFSFFDLAKHWEGFCELCKAKAARVVRRRERLVSLPSIAMTAAPDRVSA